MQNSLLPSKHSAKPMEGRVKIADNSGLRKRMRAARRGMLPPEVLGTIERAVRNAQKDRCSNEPRL
jgi:hypothetical protein